MKGLIQYLESSYNIDPSTSATIFISVFIFFLGLFFQFIFSTIRGWQERRKVRILFKITLDEFINKTKEQSIEYGEKIDELSFDSNQYSGIKRSTIYSIESINNIGYQNLYNAYFTGIENFFKCNLKRNLSAFLKIWDSIKSVEYWHPDSFKSISQFTSNYNSINDDRNNAIEQSRQFIENLDMKYNGKEIKNELAEYLKSVGEIHKKWHSIGESRRTKPHIVNDQLVKPLLALNQANQNISYANHLNNPLLNAELEFINLKTILDSEQKKMKSNYYAFRKHYRLVEKAKNII